eukprot:TRINITY_DN4979_c0_g1_i1.p1 TRINITY_DN4979_c0_g1~~TRINITY_DN4979_c0_g1_i1.p1  ORF type:complete len:475 (-),score=43.87 TRINITY_DN4979_c0_g1_i1:276-1700(-)
MSRFCRQFLFLGQVAGCRCVRCFERICTFPASWCGCRRRNRTDLSHGASGYISESDFEGNGASGPRPSPLGPEVETAGGRRARKKGVKRILDRNEPEFQSSGKITVSHRGTSTTLLSTDLFHIAIHLPFYGLFLLFLFIYVLCFTIFAFFWWRMNEPCEIGHESFLDAFYLSVETQLTIGYGVDDPNFGGCKEAAILIVIQCVCGTILDAVVIGVVFQQISSAYARANTIVFSDVAVLQVIDGVVHLIFRVAEMSRQPLLQSVMQVYCVQHLPDASQHKGVRVEVSAMQLQEPDTDVHNGVLFLGLPAMVVHKIDYNSPLAPDLPQDLMMRVGSPTSPLGIVRARSRDMLGAPSPAEVKQYLANSPYLEVLVLLSGTEDATANTVEARHSYTLDDIYWNRAFATCVHLDKEGFHCVDFEAFHETIATGSSDMPGSFAPHHVRLTFPATFERTTSESSEESVSARSATSSPGDLP